MLECQYWQTNFRYENELSCFSIYGKFYVLQWKTDLIIKTVKVLKDIMVNDNEIILTETIRSW